MNNEFSTDEEDSRGPNYQICCLIDDGDRCRNSAGNAAYGKRIQKTVVQQSLKLSVDQNAHHIYICDFHKNRIQCARTKCRQRDSDDDSSETDTDPPKVDLHQLKVKTLNRYKRHYKISTRPGMNKVQLADKITEHFKTIPVNEKEVITYFMYMVKSNTNKLDEKNDST